MAIQAPQLYRSASNPRPYRTAVRETGPFLLYGEAPAINAGISPAFAGMMSLLLLFVAVFPAGHPVFTVPELWMLTHQRSSYYASNFKAVLLYLVNIA